MDAIKSVRVANLKKLGMSARELARDYGRTYSYWQGLLNGSRSFAEKSARKIEDDLGLERGELDRPAGSESTPFAELTPEEASFLNTYRLLGKVGGRPEQIKAATDLGFRLTQAARNLPAADLPRRSLPSDYSQQPKTPRRRKSG